jgi:hypothetical protein
MWLDEMTLLESNINGRVKGNVRTAPYVD